MEQGHAYDAWDSELMSLRLKAKKACHQFNLADPSKIKARMAFLNNIIKFDGKAFVEPNFYCDYGFNIHVGERFYANHNLTILDVCTVTIGSDVLFGPNVMISTATHHVDPAKRHASECALPITIGNNVWLGGNVSVLPGVTIGNNSVIGAGSVVTKDIPENCVAAGAPCKFIRSI
ncbi:sugar O-acetyltransferase [Echinimonas agarilytica]|uniref:Acetyltransferase n=1 Tax=Echinimonas agarilytica TaxID=1215918 RepID=A0AA41W4G8_9GAMM|nr:sugar O-acetyltransferase [Echinimonas agarilytica]MCM2678769.1 sugar O-acetyltransferase [Echinimonas agarilytica]